MKEFIKTRNFKILLGALAGLIVLLMVFQIGIFVGYRKASFSYGLGDNYYRAFGDKGMMGREFGGGRNSMMGIPLGGFPDSHGTIGRVISVSLPTFVVQDQAGVEKIVRIKDDTAVMSMREKIDGNNIAVDDFVAVIGAPNANSEIEAKLIRIMPVPFTASTTPIKK